MLFIIVVGKNLRLGAVGFTRLIAGQVKTQNRGAYDFRKSEYVTLHMRKFKIHDRWPTTDD